MFSPFRDAQGNPKDLPDITYADLTQLAAMDEGYVLEFKRTFNASVKAKVPKIIASFANSRGGWLVIGIADDDHALCPVPRASADYSQMIGEMARRHISPAPPFDVRFLPDPENEEQGVIVIKVEEGSFPPYVADGVVEIREGSTSGPATGAALVELYDKAMRRHARIAEFCRRTVYFARPVPLFDLYLYRLDGPGRDAPDRDEVARCADAMRRAFAGQRLDCHVQHAHDSLIFRTSIAFDGMVPHSAIELFPDESLKLTVPAVLCEPDERDRALAALRAACGSGVHGGVAGREDASDALAGKGYAQGSSGPGKGESGDDTLQQESLPASGERAVFGEFSASLDRYAGSPQARVLSASDTLRRVTRMASILDRYIRQRKGSWQDYAAAYELENMAGVLLWSDDALYLDYARSHGPLFCGTTDCRSRVRYLNDGAHDSFRARQFAGSHFFEACGLPLGSPSAEDNALVDALLRTERDARKPS